jgi:hypothetical protein
MPEGKADRYSLTPKKEKTFFYALINTIGRKSLKENFLDPPLYGIITSRNIK